MNGRPDVAGVLEALAALPDRTPEQLAAYAVQRSAIEGAAPFHAQELELLAEIDLEDAREEALVSVLDKLGEAKLSKAARQAISKVLDVEWPEAS